jgi:hypothetical protein
MADFFKGLSGGLQTGLQFGQAMREGEERKRLREAMGLTPQEIAPRPPTQDELGRAIAETQARTALDEKMFDEGTVNSVERRTGLFSSNPAERPLDASVAPQMPYVGQSVGGTQYRLGGQTFSRMPTQQEIDTARYAAASSVIAERDPVAAMRMRREMDEQAYQARIRPEQEAQIKRQGLLTEGQIKAMNKTQERETKLEAVDTDVAQWQSKRLLDPNTNEPRQPTMDDNIAALQYRATALQKAGLNKEATDSLRDYQGFAVNQIKLDETQRNSQLGAVAAAIATGDLGPAAAFYDRYVLDGAKVTGMKSDPKTGAITVSRVRDDGAPMPDKVIKGGANELLAALNSFKDPNKLYEFSQNEFTNNLNLRKTVAAEKTAEADVSLKNARAQGLKRDSATLAKLDAIDQQLEAIPPEEMSGPVARGLITQRNAIVAGTTKQVNLGAPPKAERPALSEADKTARAKAMVEARDIDPTTGKKFTLNGAIKFLEGGSRDPIREALDKALGGSDPFAPTTPTARPAAASTGLQTQTTPARNAPVEPNPFVDARGRPLAVAPAGAPSVASTAVPAAVSAVEGAVGTQAAATRYLQAKIARNEPLTPTDRARAVQLGLIR